MRKENRDKLIQIICTSASERAIQSLIYLVQDINSDEFTIACSCVRDLTELESELPQSPESFHLKD